MAEGTRDMAKVCLMTGVLGVLFLVGWVVLHEIGGLDGFLAFFTKRDPFS